MLNTLLIISASWLIIVAEGDQCELTPEVGTYISSQNFPNHFNSGNGQRNAYNCLYKLKVEEGKKVLLTFYHVELPTDKWYKAYIKIMDKDGSVLYGKSFNSEQVLSETSELEFKFVHDYWESHRGWVAKYETVDQHFQLPETEGSYLLDYPSTLLHNRTQQVCVAALNDENLEDVDVTIDVIKVTGNDDIPSSLNGPPLRSQTVAAFGDSGSAGDVATSDTQTNKESFEGKLSNGCVDIRTNHEQGQVMLRIILKKNNQIKEELYRFVKIQDTKDRILIQTDKGKYKSGSTVKIRWLTLDDNLKNSGLNLTEVNVADPQSKIIQQWKLLQNTEGITQKEFDLFEEAPLGKYTITIKVDDTREHKAFFEVDEYILPRFEVNIKDPSAVIPGSDSIWKVCAQYTHGAPVPGQIQASFSTKFFQESLNKTVKSSEESSCTEIVLGPEELKNLTKQFTSNRRKIALNIDFIEDGTKEVRKANTNNNLVLEEFKIGFGSSSESYSVGGFHYIGQIKVVNHDGSPRSDERLKICTNLTKEIKTVKVRVKDKWLYGGVMDLFVGRRRTRIHCREISSHRVRISWHLRQLFKQKCRRNRYLYIDDFLEEVEEIEYRLFGQNCQTFNTDEMGLIPFHFHLNGLNEEVKKLSIEVTAPDYTPKVELLKTPEGKLEIDLSITSAPISMSIQSKERSELACGETNQVTVNFSGPKDTNHKIKYYLLAGGQNVRSGEEDVNLTGESDNLYQDYVEFRALGNFSEDPNKRIRQVNIRFPVDYRSYPNVKLVVMVTAGNETLTDSHEFKVGFCTKHKVALKLNKDQTQPRGEVNMDITAEIGSKCGVSLIDKSSNILGNDNKVTQKKLGDILCDIKRSNNLTSDDFNEIQEKCPEVYKIIKVFLDAGRQIYSDMPIFKNCDTYKRTKETLTRQYSNTRRTFHIQNFDDIIADLDEYHYDSYDYGMSFMDMAPSNQGFDYYSQSAFSLSGDSIQASMHSSPTRIQHRQRSRPRQSYRTRPANLKEESDVRREEQEPVFNPKDAPEVRTQFPETWLFELETFDGTPRSYNAPDTLTSWTAEAVCLSPENGLGIATPQNLIVTQDFFSDLRLPATVKRGESFPMNISVFNNLNSGLPLVLTIQGENIQPDEHRKELCLDGQSSRVLSIPTRALKAGDVNISVALEISSVQGCEKAQANSGFVDRLERPLLVKPEGIPVEEVISEMVCLNEGESQDVQFDRLTLPDQVVADSDRAYAFISGDVMAASLKNIGNLVRLPTGCGEQNMIGLAPNVYLLDYMKSTFKNDPELEEKAKGFMRIGVKRQARYKHSDGSYSVWGGDNDKDSSTWLTAFVVKVFSQASKYVEVDDYSLKKSVDWLLKTQKRNGCFEKRGYVHHEELQGGESDSSLNAFVLISLFEYNEFLKKSDQPSTEFQLKIKSSIDNAAKCLVSEGQKYDFFRDDLYSLSMANYALNLASTDGFNMYPELIQEFKDVLDEKKNTTIPGALFWDATRGKKDTNIYWQYPRSLTVEVTAYNIMSLILEDRTDEAVNAVKWLAKHRNSQGGFSSTQDTVVGLQALSQYGNIIGGYSTQMTLKVTSEGEEISTLNLNEDNKQVLYPERLPKLPADIGFKLQGSGCVILQTSVRYNVPDSIKMPAFNILHKFKNDVLEICVSYTGNKSSTDMAIMEVEMLSGYKARNPEVLLNEIDQVVKKVEVKEKENIVVLYFDQLDNINRCLDVEMITEFKIKDLKPARIYVYDYYNTEDSHEILYNIN